MKKRSIYQQQSQELLRIYEQAGTSKKVGYIRISQLHDLLLTSDSTGSYG